MVGDIRTVAIPETYVNAIDSPVRCILNRPDKLNAITGSMIDALIAFFTTVDVDGRVKVVILTGSGRAFSAGIHLRQDYSQEKNKLRPSKMRDPGGTLAPAMFNCSKPITVAYNGIAVGIGMTSTLAAAIRIAPRNSEFGFSFSRIGLTMESSSSFFLSRMVGCSNATYLLATGKRYPAHSPVLQGIFAELVPEPEDVLPRAFELAQDILSYVSAMAIHLNRQLIWRNPGSAEGAHLDAPRTYPWWNELSVKTRPTAQKTPRGKL
ncbi:ClpP/crotonase-like domain-containing protein [Aspergillus novoparasiticus]|uniref:ClpP/crotonase-like domain-containing protein n=1 Tax=Aspergillus novoparasiticus TaxID=986946 RepID=A0A5N6ETX3_9EURO|nr:ClpP/crotonase-like domain-containing protein [Aspergillus novoparasiticus]